MEYFENDLTTETGMRDDGQRSWEEEFRVTIQGKLDYVLPFNGDKGKFEAGYQYYSYLEDGDYSMHDFDKEQGDFYYRDDFFSVYRFKRDIQALYTIIANQTGNLGYQIGLRGEHTHRYLGSSEEWATHTQNRFELFPSAHFSWQMAKDNSITTSYSRRTVRPRLHFLEPYVTFADSYTARTGNPGVRPEYINSFELGYQKGINNNFFSFELFYRMKKDKIERIRTVYEANVTLDSISNVGNDYSLGAEFMSNINISDWWFLNTTANLFHYRIESDFKTVGIDDESLNWQLRFSNSFELGKTTRVQLDGNYVGPSASTQGTREAFFYTNLSVRQQLLKKKLMATLSARDVLSTAQYESSQTGTGLYSYTRVSPVSPLVTLTLSYRINSKHKTKKEGPSDNLFEGSEH
jgi:outer membrane receptor protein involved in Fe transport